MTNGALARRSPRSRTNRKAVKERTLQLTERQLLDLEQLLEGGFAPLSGFLDEFSYHSVVEQMRLPNGKLWPMPIVLDVRRECAARPGDTLTLTDAHGNAIARLTVQDRYQPDKLREAELVYGTTNEEHPGVRYLLERTGDTYLGGDIERLGNAVQPDFPEYRYTPKQLKARFRAAGIERVVAFQTRNPLHRVHYEILTRAAAHASAHILLHPVAGQTQDGDVPYPVRVRGYKSVVERHLGDRATLALLPIAMRMAGPREALWHALMRKNYGATHFVVGRDHAGPRDASGTPIYGPYDAQSLALTHQHELGIEILPVPEMVYVSNKRAYVPVHDLESGDEIQTISGTEFRSMLRSGVPIPEWFAFPEVIAELRTQFS